MFTMPVSKAKTPSQVAGGRRKATISNFHPSIGVRTSLSIYRPHLLWSSGRRCPPKIGSVGPDKKQAVGLGVLESGRCGAARPSSVHYTLGLRARALWGVVLPAKHTKAPGGGLGALRTEQFKFSERRVPSLRPEGQSGSDMVRVARTACPRPRAHDR